MRELTFPGFLKQYVAGLATEPTHSMSQLVKDASTGVPRLREPLLLYAVFHEREDLLLSESRGTSCEEFFCKYVQRWTRDELLHKLGNKDPDIPYEFQKVWNSYQVRKMRSVHDQTMKELLRSQILSLQESKSISTYRICKDLGINNTNACTWLRTGDSRFVTVDTAQQMYRYLEDPSPQVDRP